MGWEIGLPVAAAAAVAAATPTVLRALPAPADEPGSDPYRPLATRWFALAAFALMALAGSLATICAPAAAPAWAGLCTAGVLAAMVDARTSYLPKRLMQAGWAFTAAGVLLASVLAGDVRLIARAAAGGLAATALFWLFWRFGGGFGFGDVRLAPVIGAASAAVSWTVLAGALLLGGLAGVAWGLLWRAAGRGRAFPYGPALVAGPFLALLARALTAG